MSAGRHLGSSNSSKSKGHAGDDGTDSDGPVGDRKTPPEDEDWLVPGKVVRFLFSRYSLSQ